MASIKSDQIASIVSLRSDSCVTTGARVRLNSTQIFHLLLHLLLLLLPLPLPLPLHFHLRCSST